MHVGHRALIAHLAEGARGARARAIAATFGPLPSVALGQDPPDSMLSTIGERERLLHDAGADDVAVLTFDAAFAAQSADHFVERLCGAGAIKRVVVGPDFQFGHGREGDVRSLRAQGARLGFDLAVAEPVLLEGGVVSSTRIREALRAGALPDAERLLARPYAARGTVARGERRGRELGYPTINVETAPEKLLPRDGIYACWLEVAGVRHRAATSLGTRPTFGPGPRTLECHLLDFSGDLYGAAVTVTFVKRLRDELKFPGPAALATQIARDVEETREALR